MEIGAHYFTEAFNTLDSCCIHTLYGVLFRIFLSVYKVVKQSATTFATRKYTNPTRPHRHTTNYNNPFTEYVSCSVFQQAPPPPSPDPLCPSSRFLPAGRLLAGDSPCTSPTRTTARSAVDRPWCPHLRRTHNTQSARPGSQRPTELTAGFLCAPPGGWKGPGQQRTKPQESPPVTHSRFIINGAAGTLVNCSAAQEIYKVERQQTVGKISSRSNFEL